MFYRLSLNMEKINSFFWWCAGIDSETIKKCPSESGKYFGIGASVFFTGIFASLSGGYALYTVFDSIIYSILFGLLWGLMIFNLDRYIVSSMRKKGKFINEFGMAVPRIILAIIISIVIAKPLELKVFEKEIESEIVLMEQEDITIKETVIKNRFTAENEKLKNEIHALRKAINEKAEKRDEMRRIAQEEADGTGGSKRRNAGPIYEIKKADADRLEKELLELKEKNNELINSKLAKIEENNSLITSGIKSMKSASLNGFASRLEAMSRLAEKSNAILIAHWFIILLFIAVETAPIFVKLIAPRGPYDFLQNSQEYKYEAEHYEDLAKTNYEVKKRSEQLTKAEEEFVINKLKVGIVKVSGKD